MISPTAGRVVWFTPSTVVNDPFFVMIDPTKPCAATVAYVWGDRMVNLAVFDQNGNLHPRTSVPLLQDDDRKPETGYFCSWMPYQVGQAAKTEAAEKAAAS
jgi:hypothetical protein